MTETIWGPATTMLVAGAVLGIIVAIVISRRLSRGRHAFSAEGGAAGPVGGEHAGTRDGEPNAGSSASRVRTAVEIENLQLRKEALIRQLRDVDDLDPSGEGSSRQRDRQILEREAAMVMRQLSEAEQQNQPSSASGVTKDSDGPSKALISPQLKGALVGGGVVAFAGLMALALWQGTRPRAEGMGITGNDNSTVSGAVASNGDSGAPSGRARAIVAKETERLTNARAALQANPDDLTAMAEYGYALIDAGGWIEAFQNAGRMLGKEADHSDGLIQMAMIRAAMGQRDAGRALLDQVLDKDPDNLRALEVRGRLALMSGNRDEAITFWQRGEAKVGPGSLFATLIAQAKNQAPASAEPLPQGHPPLGGKPKLPVGHPPASASQPATRSPMESVKAKNVIHDTATVSGVVKLADGVSVPDGGMLFIIARPAGATSGPPVAVKRLPIFNFPQPFQIGAADAMMGGTMPEQISLSVRLDSDGNVISKHPDDLMGAVAEPVALGARNVTIQLKSAAD